MRGETAENSWKRQRRSSALQIKSLQTCQIIHTSRRISKTVIGDIGDLLKSRADALRNSIYRSKVDSFVICFLGVSGKWWVSCSTNSCLTGAFPFLGNLGSSMVWISVVLPCKTRVQKRLNEKCEASNVFWSHVLPLNLLNCVNSNLDTNPITNVTQAKNKHHQPVNKYSQ